MGNVLDGVYLGRKPLTGRPRRLAVGSILCFPFRCLFYLVIFLTSLRLLPNLVLRDLYAVHALQA